MLEQVASQLADQLSPEVVYTAISLTERYGALLSVEQYAELTNLKVSTVHRLISDETIQVNPIKVGRNNFFTPIEVSKMLHAAKDAA